MTRIKTLLLAVLSAPLIASAATNLVANGDFETTDFTSWTVGGNVTGGFNGSYYGVDCTSGLAASGSCNAYFAETKTATTLSQTLTLAASTQYTVSFMLSQAFSGTPSTLYPNAFTASFNGASLASGNNLPDSNGAYTAYSYLVNTAASGNTGVLSFSFLDDSGYYFLDSVSVVAAPAAAVPETSTPLLMGAGLLALGVAARRKRK